MIKGEILFIQLEGTDEDGDVLTGKPLTFPENGSLLWRRESLFDGASSTWVYVPAPGFSGTDRFIFSVDDGRVPSVPGVVEIVVRDRNLVPVAEAKSSIIRSGQVAYIGLTAKDGDGDPLSFRISTPPRNGQIVLLDPMWFLDDGWFAVYVPNGGFQGADTFYYVASDQWNESAPAKVSIAVSLNRPPIAETSRVTTANGKDAVIRVRASDADGDTLSFSIERAPVHGRLTGDLPVVTYRPDPGYAGLDGFVFTVSDGQLRSQPVLVTVTVQDAAPASSQ